MRITGPHNVSRPTGPKKNRETTSSGAGFSTATPKAASGSGEQAGALSGMTPLTSVDALVALQGETPDAPLKAEQRGEQMLDELDAMRLALLEGRNPRQAAGRLRALARQARTHTDHPGLEQTLQQIDVRAAVELAKLSRRAAARSTATG